MTAPFRPSKLVLQAPNLTKALKVARINAKGIEKTAQELFKDQIKAGGKGKPPRLPRLASVPQTLKYPKITKLNPIKLSREEKLLGGGAAVLGRGGISKAIQSVGKLASAARGTVVTGAALKAATAGQIAGQLLAPAAIAGVAAFFLARAVLNYRARTVEERSINANELAKAYRLARGAIQEKQRRALTTAQHQSLGNVFKKQLSELGLSTRDLSKLRSF